MNQEKEPAKRRESWQLGVGGSELAVRPFTQEDPIGIAGGLNLYGYAAGDPINFSDPFGLKVCYGTGKNAGALKSATEEATGTSITLDSDGCIESFEDVGGEKYAALQGALGALVSSEDYFHVALDETSVSLLGETKSGFGPVESLDGRQHWRARIAQADFGKPYPCGGGVGYSPPQLIAHELVGHGYDQISLSLRSAEPFAIYYENQYNRARGRPSRCR